MATWRAAHWASTVGSGVPRRDRRSGDYRRYVPDPLAGRPLALPPRPARELADAERAVRALGGPGGETLTAVTRFLLRSEAIASSRIEGVTPSPAAVALAELGAVEAVRGVSAQARLVANNMTIVRRATTELAKTTEVRLDHILELHRALLPDETRHHGLRTVQNWIGGSAWHPLDADFVPPPPAEVAELLADLLDYLNGAAHSPLVQAALVHAQFETIHPFTDGNGRVGRALIHTVLTRRGLTPTAVLPISLVLATLSQVYVDGLTSYRYNGAANSSAALAGTTDWITTFTRAATQAATVSTDLVTRLWDLQDQWRERVASHRNERGLRPTPRSDSATARLLDLLPEAPVVTARTAQQILDTSYPAASAALDELHHAGILDIRTIERGTHAYLATELLDLLTSTERRLASTAFDTRVSPPARPAPAKRPSDASKE